MPRVCGVGIAHRPTRATANLGEALQVWGLVACSSPPQGLPDLQRYDVTLIETSLRKLGFKVTVLKDANYKAMDTAIKYYVREVNRAGPGHEAETDAAKWEPNWPYRSDAWKAWPSGQGSRREAAVSE